jgi:hypothetical protein
MDIHFSMLSRQALGATHTPIQWVPVLLPRVKAAGV